MTFLVMKSCVAGGIARNAGDIIELSEAEGRSLIAMGRVQPIADAVPQETMDRSVGLAESDAPRVTKRGRKG